MSDSSGLICAFSLDGKGGGEQLDWEGVEQHSQKHGTMWVHLDYAAQDSQRWLREQSNIPSEALDFLLDRQPRPRAMLRSGGMVLVVRGVNLNAGADPEDMISVRVWIDDQQVVTMRHRKVNALKATRRALSKGLGPRRSGRLIVVLVENLLEGIARTVEELDDQVDRLEDEVLASQDFALRRSLAEARRQAIALRRHIAPERDVLCSLHTMKVSWLTEVDRGHLQEAAARLTRLIDDLDSARERAAVTQEEVASRLSELMNKRLYVLSMVAAIFLPLSLVTGIWGANVGGIPLERNPAGFAIMAGVVVLFGVVQVLVFRLLKWL